MTVLKNEIKVGIAEYKLGTEAEKLITVGLGSCVGTIIYDKKTKIGGLSHIMLPDSVPFENKGVLNTAKFANLAIPEMVAEIKKKSPAADLVAKIVGGANMFNFNNGTGMSIGERNVLAVKSSLASLRIPIISENVGGNSGKTMIVDLKDFKTMVRIVNHEIVYI
ncbi:chemotaxis protein CheD [Liquorilactobacillus hordei]|uniref:chemotaxis protein CheD n=1 Tax=Liquorilactobacillus hordei TaxID=468911 RepID=UPI001CBB7473|nr:chemotaxis protein CheD [Liquorilactobacillus hordei]MBZ2405934.1 chemotaxis protein CheD [Liquorilactobacillus hordei]